MSSSTGQSRFTVSSFHKFTTSRLVSQFFFYFFFYSCKEKKRVFFYINNEFSTKYRLLASGIKYRSIKLWILVVRFIIIATKKLYKKAKSRKQILLKSVINKRNSKNNYLKINKPLFFPAVFFCTRSNSIKIRFDGSPKRFSWRKLKSGLNGERDMIRLTKVTSVPVKKAWEIKLDALLLQ